MPMLAVIFEVEAKEGRESRYFELAAGLRPELEKIDGFISVERFQSLTNKRKYLSLSFWRDEAAVARWRSHFAHQGAQTEGKREIFRDFRIRVGTIVRDYNLADRMPASAD
jgi:heme-degrading monooxygenase HmoA